MFSYEAYRALLLSFLAGMSTILGAFFIYIKTKDTERLVTISLGFAAGVMVSVSFSDLFPNANMLLIQYAGDKMGVILGVFFLAVGILLAAGIDHFVPHQEYDETTGEASHKDLFRVGFVSTIAIGLHNFPEGIATFMAGYENAALGISIALAIALHNIPEGVSVAMPIYYATGSKKKAFQYTFLSGVAEPIGALLAFLILRPFINDISLGAIFAIVAGIMVYISIEELIPSSRQYGHDREALIATFIGICIMPLTHVL